MPVSRMTKDEIKDAIVSKLQRQFGCDVSDATDDQLYQALAMTVRDEVMERRALSRGERKRQQAKKALLSLRGVSGGPRHAQQHGFAGQ